MTLSQIECFLLVVDKMSFTEAAKILYVSQPAISRRISLLEEELGMELFYRSNSRLCLTDAGVRFARLFRNFIDDYSRTISEIRSEMPSITGTVKIGCADGWDISPFLNGAKKQLESTFPGISLSVSFSDHEVLMRKLAKKELDMVIEQQDLFTTVPNVDLTPLRKVKCILMYSAGHPLAGEENLNLYSFRDHVLYMRSSAALQNMSGTVIDACIASGFKPEIEYVDSQAAAFAKMLSDDGVFFADELLIESHNPLFRFIRLPFDRTIALVSDKDKSPASEIVEKTIISCCLEQFG